MILDSLPQNAPALNESMSSAIQWSTSPAPAKNWGGEAKLFEFENQGEFVYGRLLLPAQNKGPYPFILLQHGLGGSKESDYIDWIALPWVERGLAIVAVDLPLHGARHCPKWSPRFERAITNLIHQPEAADASDHALWHKMVRQSRQDLQHTHQRLSVLPNLDPDHSAFVGLSLGSMLGSHFVAQCKELRAAVFTLGGGGFGSTKTDPAHAVAKLAAESLLFVNMEDDRTVPRRHAETLHAAVRGEPSVLWYPGDHRDLPGNALKKIWSFLAPQLGMDASTS